MVKSMSDRAEKVPEGMKRCTKCGAVASYLPEVDAIVSVDKNIVHNLFARHEQLLEECDFGWAPFVAPWGYVNDVRKSD